MSGPDEQRPTGWEDAERWFAPSARADAPTDAGDGGVREPPDDPGSGAPPHDDQPEDEGPPRCTRCESVLDGDQTYCLVCGEPTTSAPTLARSLRSPALIGGALALLGIGVAALALVLLSDGGDDAAAASGTSPTTMTVPSTTAPPATGPLPPDTSPLPPATDSTVPVPPETDFSTVTGAEPVPEPPPEPEPEPFPDPEPPPSGEFDWPLGEVAWTAVLSSVRSESDAISARDRLEAQGTEAGVLFSTDHADLRPGYYVVFSGMFGERAAAEARAQSLSGEFPGAYAREVS